MRLRPACTVSPLQSDNIYIMRNSILFVTGRGIGQVMFQNNALSGCLMLAGILISSWQTALLAVAGNLCGTLTAYVSDCRRDDIRDGLYGFNGTLVGIATGVFMYVSWQSLLFLVLASCLSVCIARLFSRQRLLPGLTAPFVLAVWLMLAACSWLCPQQLISHGAAAAEGGTAYFRAFSLGLGQVMFQGGTVLTGLLFLLAILVNSRLGALYAAAGALLSIPLGLSAGMDTTSVNAGMAGYNAVLCAMAVGDRTWRGGLWAALSAVLSVIIQNAGMRHGFPTLTAPFVLSVWIVVLLRRATACLLRREDSADKLCD